MEYFAFMTAMISLLKYPIMNIIKHYWIQKYFDAEVRKSITFLTALILGVGIALLANLIGGFGLPFMTIVMFGTGISYGVGQLSYRAIKLKKQLKNGKS